MWRLIIPKLIACTTKKEDLYEMTEVLSKDNFDELLTLLESEQFS